MWLIWKAFLLDVADKQAAITKIKGQSGRLSHLTSDGRKLARQRDCLRGKANKPAQCVLDRLLTNCKQRYTKNYMRPGETIIPKKTA